MKNLSIQLANDMLYDRLHTIAAEYAVSTDFIMNTALTRLISDIDFIRQLRMGQL